MSFLRDLKILYHLALSPIRGKTHADRLESFYQHQASGYDDFRARLLQGRKEMYEAIDFPEGGVWVDMGGGTGSNLENLGDRIKKLSKVYVVDLSGSLLKVAQERAEARGWTNVETVEADATRWKPPEESVDVVTFSYSLTMIPDWFRAIDHAQQLLRPGGRMGVVDFHVARKYPLDGFQRHSWFTRTFWPVWFANDNVFFNRDHAPYLHERFEQEQ
ncbi:MAG: class I SAM-dependent methyltransferase, partial [Planctomycetales bacterium]